MARVWAAFAALLLGGVATAETINIDFGHPGSGPVPGYRAAGLPGHWNVIEATDPVVTYDLLDRLGQPTGVTVSQFGGTEILTSPLGDAGDPTGEDATLLGDALITHTTIESCLFFNGLENGFYEVLTYAWMPDYPTVKARVHVDFNPLDVLTGGPWTGQHLERITYARHIVEVTTGFLGPHSGVSTGGSYEIGAPLNAIQIQRLEPRPTLYLDKHELVWSATLDASSFDVVIGDLATLLAGGGDFLTSTDGCVTNDRPASSVDHTDAPAPGAGHWFLVRGVGPGGAMSYDTGEASQVGSRDADIDAAALSCP